MDKPSVFLKKRENGTVDIDEAADICVTLCKRLSPNFQICVNTTLDIIESWNDRIGPECLIDLYSVPYAATLLAKKLGMHPSKDDIPTHVLATEFRKFVEKELKSKWLKFGNIQVQVTE